MLMDRHGRMHEDRGQTLAIFALFVTILIGAAALAVDYGSWLKVRRDYQNAADAAVLAGSVHLVRPITLAKQVDAREAAWRSLEEQLGLTLDEAALGATNTSVGAPVTDGSSGCLDCRGYRLWVSTPPVGGPAAYAGAYAGNNRVLFAWVEHDSPAYFSRVFGLGDAKVGAWATAGSFPNRFAIITLRKNGDPTNGNPTDIDINGGTVVRVIDGDVGGNWGMAINGVNSALVFDSTTSGDSYGPYLTENLSGESGGNNWTANQVRDAAGNPVPVQFNQEVTDPLYPAPCRQYVGGGCIEDRTATYTTNYSASTNRLGDTCPINAATNVDRLPAGRYDNIRIPNGKCVLLDPTFDPRSGKKNGIFFITGTLDMNNSALLLGDGVTLVFERGADLNMNAGASVSLNSGNLTNNPYAAACGGVPGGGSTNCRFAAWTARSGGGGNYSWSEGLSPTYASPPVDPFERGIASYVCKSSASCESGGGPSTNILQANSNSGFEWQGLVYAPFDNVKLAGQPTHNNIGQLVAWTVMFTGGVDISQTFDGPDSAAPALLEPRLGQ